MQAPAVDNAESLVLAARPNAIGLSRAMVAAAMKRWGLAQTARDDAAVIVSELVTNAVKATGSVVGKLPWDQLRDVGMIKVQIARRDSCVLVEVWDSDPATPPELRDAPPGAVSGRG